MAPTQILRPRAVTYVPDRPLPHDLAAERAVLAAVLLDNDALAEVEGLLTPDDFYEPKHATVWSSFVKLRGRGERIDVITVSHALREDNRINTVGGPQFLGDITDDIPTIAHVASHANIVADLAMVRRVMEASIANVMEGHAGASEPAAFVDKAQRRVTDATTRARRSAFATLSDSVVRAFERIEQSLASGQRTLGVPTGFHDLDKLMGGLAGGQFVIIAARPAMGKTSFALNIATNVALSLGRPVAFFSLEMPTVELVNRALCSEARVDLLKLRTSTLCQFELDRLTKAANDIHGLPIFIADDGLLTPAMVRAGLRELSARHGKPALVVIDYLQLMRLTHERMPSSEREKEVSEITRTLKGVAKEFDVPIVALSQLNRNLETRPGKNRRPILADLRESGAIEQDADVVMFVYRDEVYNRDSEDKGVAEIILAKQRNGPTDTVRLRFTGSCTLFENFAQPKDPYYVEPGNGSVPGLADNIPDNDIPDY